MVAVLVAMSLSCPGAGLARQGNALQELTEEVQAKRMISGAQSYPAFPAALDDLVSQ
jgi:hypothetical protein